MRRDAKKRRVGKREVEMVTECDTRDDIFAAINADRQKGEGKVKDVKEGGGGDKKGERRRRQ